MGGLFSKPSGGPPPLSPIVINKREMVIMSLELNSGNGNAKARGFKVAQKPSGDAHAGGLYTVLKGEGPC